MIRREHPVFDEVVLWMAQSVTERVVVHYHDFKASTSDGWSIPEKSAHCTVRARAIIPDSTKDMLPKHVLKRAPLQASK